MQRVESVTIERLDFLEQIVTWYFEDRLDQETVDGAELACWLADKLGASYRYLLAPLLVKDQAAARVLLGEPAVVETLDLAAKAEVALLATPSASKRTQRVNDRDLHGKQDVEEQ
jgi:DNA-binding transcriptional regulator LsrR (DeoR family)